MYIDLSSGTVIARQIQMFIDDVGSRYLFLLPLYSQILKIKYYIQTQVNQTGITYSRQT